MTTIPAVPGAPSVATPGGMDTLRAVTGSGQAYAAQALTDDSALRRQSDSLLAEIGRARARAGRPPSHASLREFDRLRARMEEYLAALRPVAAAELIARGRTMLQMITGAGASAEAPQEAGQEVGQEVGATPAAEASPAARAAPEAAPDAEADVAQGAAGGDRPPRRPAMENPRETEAATRGPDPAALAAAALMQAALRQAAPQAPLAAPSTTPAPAPRAEAAELRLSAVEDLPAAASLPAPAAAVTSADPQARMAAPEPAAAASPHLSLVPPGPASALRLPEDEALSMPIGTISAATDVAPVRTGAIGAAHRYFASAAMLEPVDARGQGLDLRIGSSPPSGPADAESATQPVPAAPLGGLEAPVALRQPAAGSAAPAPMSGPVNLRS